jgi:hypothetical protein
LSNGNGGFIARGAWEGMSKAGEGLEVYFDMEKARFFDADEGKAAGEG